MDGTVLALFLFAAFLGGFASGVAGFAMGFVVSGIWLHIITPVQTTALIVGYGLWTQGYGVWKLRHSLSWRNVAPFIIGGTIGVPIGTMLLTYMDPAYCAAAWVCCWSFTASTGWRSPASSRCRPELWRMAASDFSTGCCAGSPDSRDSSSPSGASCAAGPRTCSARSFSP